MKTTLFATLLALSSIPSANAANPPPPCSSPEHRQFDFWIGDWEVTGANGKVAGHNRITREYNGCVIHEHYTTDRNYNGESLNVYDAARGVWHQTWVDDSGLLLTLEGRWNGKSLILEGLAPDAKGTLRAQRITWTPNADGSVRQLWEAADGDNSWNVVFDGRYVKK